jgi:hypothetical protein
METQLLQQGTAAITLADRSKEGTLGLSAGAPGARLVGSGIGITSRVTAGGRRWTASAAQPQFCRHERTFGNGRGRPQAVHVQA